MWTSLKMKVNLFFILLGVVLGFRIIFVTSSGILIFLPHVALLNVQTKLVIIFFKHENVTVSWERFTTFLVEWEHGLNLSKIVSKAKIAI